MTKDMTTTYKKWSVRSKMSYMKAIHEILEEVKEDICDNYCKYEDVIKNVHMTDEEYEKWIEEHCDKCPLNKL